MCWLFIELHYVGFQIRAYGQEAFKDTPFSQLQIFVILGMENMICRKVTDQCW